MTIRNDKRARHYWRSLNELSDSEDFRREHSVGHHDAHSSERTELDRRSFLALMGASMALAGLAGCRRPIERIVPYVDQPENVIPGVPKFYATTMPRGNSALGLVVETHEGRPTKIEGNPGHPASRGSTDFFAQAEILALYDPDRSRSPYLNNEPAKYEDFVKAWAELAKTYEADDGQGLAILSESYAGPTLARLRREFEKKYEKATWIVFDPISGENELAAARAITEKDVRPVCHVDKAKVILSLDSDFLQHHPDNVLHARGFADGRRVESTKDDMNRLYVIESGLSVTGGMADHRLRVPSSQSGGLLRALADRMRKPLDLNGAWPSAQQGGINEDWLTALAEDLLANRGQSLIIVGERQPQWVHGLALTLNAALGNIGSTIELRKIEDAGLSSVADLTNLTTRMKDGMVSTLVMLGGNPVYNAPADTEFATALKKVKTTIHLSSHRDETSKAVNWHLPRAHFLESWSDCRAVDGTMSLVQPMIEPLHKGHTCLELLNTLLTGVDTRGHDLVKETWKKIVKGNDYEFDKRWRKVLHDGWLPESESDTEKYRQRKSIEDIIAQAPNTIPEPTAERLEIGFYESNLGDGRYANNGWLQELPDSVSKLAWDNAALLSPATAGALNVVNGDVVQLNAAGRTIESPAWIQPGVTDNTVSLWLGYGRSAAGRVGDNVGGDVYPLRTTDGMYFVTGASLTKTDRSRVLANTQDHSRMEGRPIVREASLDEYQEHPEFARDMVEHPPLKSIYPDYDYSRGYQWGMTIDLNCCTGCNACVIACQSENNVPIVGREQVTNGREMHWIRTDRYFTGDQDNPEMVLQPIPCQQCENAPCETVCPVAATSHDREGLNTMNYNRCIGTRYCSNNCPYKVRRFNFFNYTNELPELVQMAQNPDVTVRSRGVMEKCTYCIQRLNRHKIQAKLEGRQVVDGEIQAACQQACPTKAIQFGNINDPNSEVTRHKKLDRNYELLAELNVRPRTSYLARLRNPNQKLRKMSQGLKGLKD